MDNTFDNKKADNRSFDESFVETKKKKLDEISDTRDLFINISKKIDRCIDLLDKSVKKNNNNRDLDALRDENKKNLFKVLAQLDNSEIEIEKKYREYMEKEYQEKEHKDA